MYPAGHPRVGQLRYRSVVVSLARQSGKTELAAALGLIGLLRAPNQLVIGIASSAEQARIVYKRTMHAIAANPSLAKRFQALTETRGIRSKDGGVYELKAAKGAALQGLPVDLGVVDEVHLLKPDLWNALINGLGGRPNGLVVGITTAGSEDSELLADLYVSGRKAADGDPKLERFGFFLWEAPETRVPEDDETLLDWLAAASPALACGRLDGENILADVRTMPPGDIIRYRLNRFTESTEAFLPLSLWGACQRDFGAEFPKHKTRRPVFAIDRSPDWGYATITANIQDDGGIVHTEIVASFVRPTLEQLVAVCTSLYRWSPSTFVMENFALKELAAELTKRGLPAVTLSNAEVFSASSMFYARVLQKRIRHAGDPLLSVQMPRTVRKQVGEGFRISRKDSSIEIDAAIATVIGAYWATRSASDTVMQLFGAKSPI